MKKRDLREVCLFKRLMDFKNCSLLMYAPNGRTNGYKGIEKNRLISEVGVDVGLPGNRLPGVEPGANGGYIDFTHLVNQ